MKISIVDANLRHLGEVLDDMRDWELERCVVMFGSNVENEAARILSQSLMAYAILVDGRCVALYGVYVTNIFADEGYLWMLGTKFLEEHPITFLRHSKKRLEEVRASFSRLYGASSVEIDAGSEKWLKWLGFSPGAVQDGIRSFVME